MAPALWLCGVSFVLASDALGVRPEPWAYVVWWVGLGVAALITFGFMAQKIPDRYVQLASCGTLWLPAAMTAVGMYSTHLGVYATLFIAQIASAGALLHRRLALGTIIAFVGVAVWLIIRSDGPFMAVYISVLVFAAVGAVPIHFFMTGAIVRAERHRAAADEAAHQLVLRIEELQRANAERALLHDQLLHSQRMEAVGTLAAGIAHDMNNVLASINGLGDLLLGELKTAQLRADVEEILAQTERGAVLTRSLLAFSRRGQYRKRPLRLWELVSGVLPMLDRTLPKSIEIDCELADEACIDADSTHLEQVLVNLALNAKDAMSGTGRLTIRGEIDGGFARLSVTDTGIGMDEPTRLRAFEPFFTTKPMGKGTGLGLSTVWGIVQAHGGTIAVDSRPGHGATFSIRLPLSQSIPVALARSTTSQEFVPLNISGTVLIVDDEAAVRNASKRQLEKIGLDVITAENGFDALEKFAAHKASIALIILDMGMPGMGGAECFARIREQSDVPVLIATGYAIEEEAQKLVGQGASFLEKPYASDAFRREVLRLLKRSRQLKPRASSPRLHERLS